MFGSISSADSKGSHYHYRKLLSIQEKVLLKRYKLGATLHSQMAGTSGSRPLEMNAVVSNLQFTEKLGEPSADKWAPKLAFIEANG